jgi:beta-glucosidase
MDNFEWLEGEAARFGLTEVDFDTQQRKLRKSGEFYSEVSRNNGVTKSMLKRFALE